MKLEDKFDSELIELRKEARLKKDFKLSDLIRDYLDSRHIFIFDTKDGQIIYNEVSGDRNQLIAKLNKSIISEKAFDSWLYSIKSSIKK